MEQQGPAGGTNPATADPAPVDLWAIGTAIATISLVGSGLSLTIPLLSLEMTTMQASPSLIGLNTAAAGIASVAAAPFVPRLAARIGVLRLLALCVATVALSLLAFKATFSVMWWFPLRFVFGAAITGLFVLSEYWINAAAPPHRRGLVIGIYASVLALGFAVGPLLLALFGTSGWPPYLAGAGLFGLGLIPLMAARGLSPELGHAPRRPLWDFVRGAPIAAFAALIFGAVETGCFALLPVYGRSLGLEPDNAAQLVSLVALGNIACQIPIGLWADRVDRRRVLLVMAILGLAGSLAMPLVAHQPLPFKALLFAWGGVVGALYTVGLAHLGARFHGEDLAGANAAFVMLYNVGLTLGPFAIGAGMDLSPPHGFAWSLAALCALYVAIVAARLARAGRRPAS